MIADAYFQCKPEHLTGFQMAVMPDNDVLALDIINHSKEIYRDIDKIICHCRLDDGIINELAYQANTFNPLDISAVEAIGITWTYLGRTLAGVYERYPELEGTKEVEYTDDLGVVIKRQEPIIMGHIWA